MVFHGLVHSPKFAIVNDASFLPNYQDQCVCDVFGVYSDGRQLSVQRCDDCDVSCKFIVD